LHSITSTYNAIVSTYNAIVSTYNAIVSTYNAIVSTYNVIALTDNTIASDKNLFYRLVGWVEERNPTFSRLCWVSLRSTQPTIILN